MKNGMLIMFWIGFIIMAGNKAFGNVTEFIISDSVITVGCGVMYAILSLKSDDK